ncbi:MAG: AAA-like domain-containing protein [Nostocaceae cyanobacterium]|nr:AAA-like domain-containing protein [Nostocaceae cyanobacterium]
MSLPNQLSKRKRGVILTLSGWQRLQAAKRQFEIEKNFGNLYTLEELSEWTHLSPNTLTKIHNRKVAVDRQSLESYFSAFNLTLNNHDYTKLSKDSFDLETRQRVTLKGQVPLNSPFYIERQPIEELCCETIFQPGALIRIKAAKLMGKTSLMARIISAARTRGCKTVTLSFHLADTTVFSNLTRFLQWFCAIVTRKLGLPNQIAEYWDEMFGSNYNCTDYFENYLLANIDSPVVLALDEVDIVFNYPEIATDFFGLLRAWYEKAKYGDDSSESWQKLRLLVVHSTEVYLPININQSPFNVGFSVELPEFNQEQVHSLAMRYQLDWKQQEVEQLMALVGGNPYLLRVAMEQIIYEDITLEQLLETAVIETGIYSNFLRRQLWNLKQYPELINAFSKVVMSTNPVEIEPIQAFKLQSMGLVSWENQRLVSSCDLYRQYFRDYFSKSQLTGIQENRRATIAIAEVVDCANLLQVEPEETQIQIYKDFQIITQICGQFNGQVLKSIEGRLLIYFPNPLNAVKSALEIQLTLKQAAEFNQESVLHHRIGIHTGEVVFHTTNIMGNGVKIAEYLKSEATSGGIYISQTVYDAVKNYLPVPLFDLGERQVPGNPEPISLYELQI